MNFTLLTCTGDRPEAFALCEKYVARQTLKPTQWIVMDDGDVPVRCTMGQEHHHIPQMQGTNSLCRKVTEVLRNDWITGDAVAFFEDDDWYAPDWLEFAALGLENYSIYGEGKALYYNVKGRWWHRHINLAHASLCSTVCRRDSFKALLDVCVRANSPWIDTMFWDMRHVSRSVFDPLTMANGFRHRVVGIKSMPGRVGYSLQHKSRPKGCEDDFNLSFLTSAIGDDAALYDQFYDASWGTVPEVAIRTKLVTHSMPAQIYGQSWAAWLGKFRSVAAHGLEIGTFEVDTAEFLLENILTRSGSTFTSLGLGSSTRASERLGKFPNARVKSGGVLELLKEDRKYDFIFLDQNRDAMAVLRDAVIAYEVLNSGGVMVFSNYKWSGNANLLERPKKAVDAFSECYLKGLRPLGSSGEQMAFIKQ